MVLFLHGTGATSSLWLSHIRNIFGLNQDYSDKQILDLFTISFPGHPTKDRNFDYSDIENQINAFLAENRSKQSELAQKLLFSNNKIAVNALRNPKLILIGHSLGGAVSVQYALRNLDVVTKIVSISSGFGFNHFALSLIKFLYYKIIFKLGLRQLQAILYLVRSLRLKTILNICIENPERKGLISSENLLFDYNFENLYKKMSLDEQLKFRQIKVLGINGQFDFLNLVSSMKKLQTFLLEQNKILNLKHTSVLPKTDIKLGTIIVSSGKKTETLVSEKSIEKTDSTNFQYKVYAWKGHNPMDESPQRFLDDTLDFLAS